MYLSPFVKPSEVDYDQLSLVVGLTKKGQLNEKGIEYRDAYEKVEAIARKRGRWVLSKLHSEAKRQLQYKKSKENKQAKRRNSNVHSNQCTLCY